MAWVLIEAEHVVSFSRISIFPNQAMAEAARDDVNNVSDLKFTIAYALSAVTYGNLAAFRADRLASLRARLISNMSDLELEALGLTR